MNKDFWSRSTVSIVGGGSWGTVLANLVAKNSENVRLWVRSEEQAREINSQRTNQRYLPGIAIDRKIQAIADVNKLFDRPSAALVWALPASAYRETAKQFAPFIRGDEVIFHATKGVEEGSLKRISEVLQEELPNARIGVVSGPNLALEIARGEPAATTVASVFSEVVETGIILLSNPQLRVYGSKDVIGVEWSGTLKNILAIASGSLDALGFGANSRSMLITLGVAEMVRFGLAMGAKEETFLGLAGIGDLLATCSSTLSRNYRVGYELAKGGDLSAVLKNLGSTAEGVRTTEIVYEYAKRRSIRMPITEAVYQLIRGKISAQQALEHLMKV